MSWSLQCSAIFLLLNSATGARLNQQFVASPSLDNDDEKTETSMTNHLLSISAHQVPKDFVLTGLALTGSAAASAGASSQVIKANRKWRLRAAARSGPPVMSVTDYIGSMRNVLPESQILPVGYHAYALLHLQDGDRTEVVKLDTRPVFTVRLVTSLQTQWEEIYDVKRKSPKALMLFSARQTALKVASTSLPHSLGNGLGGPHVKHMPWKSLTFSEFAEELKTRVGNETWHPSEYNCQSFTEDITSVLLPQSVESGCITMSQDAETLAWSRKTLGEIVATVSKHWTRFKRWQHDKSIYGRFHQSLKEEELEDSKGYKDLNVSHMRINCLQIFWEDTGVMSDALNPVSLVMAYDQFASAIRASESSMMEKNGSVKLGCKWEVYDNYDMPFQGNVTDIRLDSEWDIQVVQSYVERNGFSGFCLDGLIAYVKKFDFPLTVDDLEPTDNQPPLKFYIATPIPYIFSDALKKSRYVT